MTPEEIIQLIRLLNIAQLREELKRMNETERAEFGLVLKRAAKRKP